MLKFKKFLGFKMLSDGKMVKFNLALDFGSNAIAKDAMHNYRLYLVKFIWIDKDDKKRLVVMCKEGCPFHLRISLDAQRQM